MQAYLELERLMLSLDERDGVSSDAIRDAMDPIWYGLSDDEREVLDQRSIGLITSLEAFRVPISQQLRYAPTDRQPRRTLPSSPITDWAA